MYGWLLRQWHLIGFPLGVWWPRAGTQAPKSVSQSENVHLQTPISWWCCIMNSGVIWNNREKFVFFYPIWQIRHVHSFNEWFAFTYLACASFFVTTGKATSLDDCQLRIFFSIRVAYVNTLRIAGNQIEFSYFQSHTAHWIRASRHQAPFSQESITFRRILWEILFQSVFFLKKTFIST